MTAREDLAIVGRAIQDSYATEESHVTILEGQSVIIHQQDETGWWLGEANGKLGWFPSTAVELLKPKLIARATFDYTHQDAGELDLKVGEIVEIKEKDDSGWWLGECNGHVGVFPYNYVEIIEETREVLDLSPAASLDAIHVTVDAAPAPSTKQHLLSDSVLTKRKSLNQSLLVAEKKPSSSHIAVTTGPALTSQASDLRQRAGVRVKATNAADVPIRPKSSSFHLSQAPPKEVTREQSGPGTLTYGLWGHYALHGAAIALLLLGIVDLWWPSLDSVKYGSIYYLVGGYCMVVSVFILLWQETCGVSFSGEFIVPFRGIIFILLGIFPCFAIPTVIAGVFTMLSGILMLISELRAEYGSIPKSEPTPAKKKKPTPADGNSRGIIATWWITKYQEGELSKIIMIIVYFSVNLALFIEAYVRWQNRVDAANAAEDLKGVSANKDKYLSQWVPFAKANGQLLNFNSALLLLPVCRHILRALNNFCINAKSDNAFYSALASFLRLLPLEKNISFHKLVGVVVLLASIAHTVAHFLGRTFRTFPVFVYVSGGIILSCMFIMYPAARQYTRNQHYEIFWFTHHLFIVFYAFLLYHGPVFWCWAIGPVVMYFIERCWRVTKGRGKTELFAVKWIPPVLNLEFSKIFEYKAGQYLYIACPFLSENEWHPFTISSAEDDDFISVHIKIVKGGWTEKLKDYLNMMNPKREYPFELTHRDDKGRLVRGKYLGPDGRPILRVDGPYAAPAQHYAEFRTVMLVGAGIGLTPSASILKSTLKYKWRKNWYPENLHFYWVCRHDEIDGFRWFVNLIKDLEQNVAFDRERGNVAVSNCLQIHIYVTRPPKELAPNNGITVDTFTEEQLLFNMKNPLVPSKEHSKIMASPDAAKNRLGNTFVWNGRPEWDQIFKQNQDKYVNALNAPPAQNIAVAYCGPKLLARDLRENCNKYSTLDPRVRFQLYKENF
eukprot:GILJ01008301.1.p1 GENE.GILJ01008301.1~~GILJ01008301.1.p1  ORF type:complete len:952 (+),score=132.75 GILJ01008301.1:36-2891(+)